MAVVTLVGDIVELVVKLNSAVDYINKVRHFREEFAPLIGGIQGLESVLNNLQSPIEKLQNTPDFSPTGYPAEILNNLAKTIDKWKKEIGNIQLFVEKYKEESRLKIFFKLSSFKEDRDRWLKSLDLQEIAFQGALSSVQLILQQAIRETQIRREQEEKRRREEEEKNEKKKAILKWLGPDTFKAKHNQNYRSSVENTWEWFSQSKDYQDWLTQSINPLYCMGKLGSGKSTLTARTIEKLRQSKRTTSGSKPVAIIYYYYDYAISQDQQPTDVASCFLRQLYARLESTSHPPLEQLYTDFLDRGVRPDMETLCSVFPSFISGFDSIFVFVDALDECAWESFAEVEGLFQHLVNLNMKVFLTSRYVTNNFKKRFKKCRVITIMPTIYDIQLYLKNTLKDHSELPHDFKKEIIEKLSVAAQGSFLFAKHHLQYILEEPTLDQKRKAISEFPPKLEDVYNNMFKQLKENSNDDTFKTILNALGWLLRAPDDSPLRMEELCIAVTLSEGHTEPPGPDQLISPDDLIRMCGNFVYLEEATGIVRLAHSSMGATLIKGGHGFPSEASLAKVCLTYLTFEAFDWGPCVTENDLEMRAKAHVFAPFAASNWARFAHDDRTKDQGLHQLAHRLFESSKRFEAALQFGPIDGKAKFQELPRAIKPIHIAAASGLVIMGREILRQPLEFSSEINALYASCLQDMNSEELAQKYGNVASYDTHGRTALHFAALKGQKEAAKILLNAGAEIMAEDDEGNTPLHYVAREGYAELADVFMSFNADVVTRNIAGEIPLHLALRTGEKAAKAADFLIAQTPSDKINIKDHSGQTPLHAAAISGNSNMIRKILDKGGDVTIIDLHMQTPLHVAASNSKYETCRLLLEVTNGSDIDSENDERQTPLHLAALGCEIEPDGNEVVSFLIKEGANVSARDGQGKTALHLVTSAQHHDGAPMWRMEVVQLLINGGIDLNLRNVLGETALLNVAESLSPESAAMAEALLVAHADVDLPNARQETPLHKASRWGNAEVVSILVTLGKANVLTRDINGDTPLHIGAGWGHKAVVEILLAHGGDTNLKNHRKQTPLDCVKSGKKEVSRQWALKPEKYGIGYDDIISLLQNSV